MSLREKKLENKVRVLRLIKNDLKEESKAIYRDLVQTRKEVGQLLDERTEEMQIEMFNIIGNMKLLLKNKRYEDLEKYMNVQYQILKDDLFIDVIEYKKELATRQSKH